MTTSFAYGTPQPSTGERQTTVTDARLNPTVYTLNAGGNPTKIEEAVNRPASRTTLMTWGTNDGVLNDVVKTSETDFLNRLTNYTYDAKGNMTSEAIHTTDFGDVTSTYEYEHEFNKMRLKHDRAGRPTRYDIDPNNGDLKSVTDAAHNVTTYSYDSHGQLQTETDPRGHRTEYSDYDSFGNARLVLSPVGVLTERRFDALGRMTKAVDRLGQSTLRSTDLRVPIDSVESSRKPNSQEVRPETTTRSRPRSTMQAGRSTSR